jgi:RNA polymerase sigma-70 factor (ECF subfamily)
MSRYLPENDIVLQYRKTIGPLYAYVSKRVGGDRALAEDIVQDTWMRALDTWPRRGTPDEPLAWLKHVARNVLASHFRRARPQPVDPSTLDIGDDRFTPETPDAAALVSWGLARLRRSQIEMLEAFHFEGLSVAEIAAASGISERAVEGRLRRARAKLRKKLTPVLRQPAETLGAAEPGGTEDARQTRAR